MLEPSDPLIGSLVSGRYKVIKRLGEGGMGQVYLAMHEVIEKKVALKVLRPEYSEKPDIVTRFQQEAISASRIKHPNVLEVFDFGQLDNGCFFLAMEFLEGHDLAEEIATVGTMDPMRALPITLQICRALGAAHSRGVVHRDMKPENVFLQRTTDGEEIVKIVDFGIAQLRSPGPQGAEEPQRRRLTKTGMIFGTPEYMAPEQAAGKTADLRVDIYAAGIILYEMFTGAVPFTGDTFMAVLASQLNDEAPAMREIAPDVALSKELEAVIMHALAKGPEERFQSMAEFSAAVCATPEGEFASRLSLANAPKATSAATGGAGAETAAQFAGGSGANRTKGQFAGAARDELGRSDSESRAGSASGETDEAPPAQSARSPLGLVVAGLLAAGAASAGAYFILADGGAAENPVGGAAPAVTAPDELPPEPHPIPEPDPAPVPAAVQGIRLHVETDPPGATILKDGFQVCETTPCEVIAALNETLELTAQLGKQKGAKKILAQSDQSINIKLEKPKRKRVPKRKPPKRSLCEREVDGIKVLVPCRD